MALAILDFLSASGISALPVDFTLADLIPYILNIWVSLGLFSAVFGAFAAVFGALLEGVR